MAPGVPHEWKLGHFKTRIYKNRKRALPAFFQMQCKHIFGPATAPLHVNGNPIRVKQPIQRKRFRLID